MANLFTKIFGTHSSHELKKIYPIADKVDALEEQYKKLTDAELRAKTDEFKARYQNGETLDDLLPEAFATCREAAWRVLGMRHYRVQVIGGIVLHQGRIAEMKTGEGKTLVATLPAYLNALTGKGVHIVTVNDYLAKRDSEWMGKVYRFLGLTVGLVIHAVTVFICGAVDLFDDAVISVRQPFRRRILVAKKGITANTCHNQQAQDEKEPDSPFRFHFPYRTGCLSKVTS